MRNHTPKGRGGDSVEALRKIWMEGYEAGKKAAGAIPVVQITRADIQRVYEAGSCGNPACVGCGAPPRVDEGREQGR